MGMGQAGIKQLQQAGMKGAGPLGTGMGMLWCRETGLEFGSSSSMAREYDLKAKNRPNFFLLDWKKSKPCILGELFLASVARIGSWL